MNNFQAAAQRTHKTQKEKMYVRAE